MADHADTEWLALKPHPFEERVLLFGAEGSFCFYCDMREDENPLHNDGFGGSK